jgi:hypothetical protein
MIDAWAAAKQLKEFFTHPKRRAQDLPGDQRGRKIERLRRARALIGSTDALERLTHGERFLSWEQRTRGAMFNELPESAVPPQPQHLVGWPKNHADQ